MTQVEKEESVKPKWLRQLQLHSWEPEILLSGIVLYGMFQMPELLDQARTFGDINFAVGALIGFDELILFLKLAIYWLIFGLILHLISRGVWVGMIGLSFTFPNGVNLENLKLSPKFSHYIGRFASMEQIIISLEKICSSLFSVSFMLFMCMIGAYLFVFIIFLLPVATFVFIFLDGNFSNLNDSIMLPFGISVLTIGLITVIDFLTLGYIKRWKWLSSIYYPVYRVTSALTLSFLYRTIYYSVVSNVSRWKISVSLVLFVVISFYVIAKTNNVVYPGDQITSLEVWSSQSQVSAFNGYYDDQNEDKHSQRAHIQSDIIRGNTVRLFVVARADLEDSIRKVCNYDSLVTELDTARMYIDLHCVKSFFKVELDDSVLHDLPWKFHYKSKTDQRGMLVWINVRQLSEGLHQLTVKGKDAGQFTYARIPFFREYSNEIYLPQVPKEQAVEESYLKVKPILPK